MLAQGGELPTSSAVWCRQARGTRAAGRVQVWDTGNGTVNCRAGASLGVCPLPPASVDPKKPRTKCQQSRGIYCLVWQTGANRVFGWVWCLGLFLEGGVQFENHGVFSVLKTKSPVEAEDCE